MPARPEGANRTFGRTACPHLIVVHVLRAAAGGGGGAGGAVGAAPGMDRVRTKVQWATTLHSRVPYTPGYPTLQRGSAAAAGAAWIEEGPSPCRGEAFISITRHDERQSLVTEQSIRRDDDPARPDSDTTVQYAPGPDRSQTTAGGGS